MGIFSKKEKIPEIPLAPELPELFDKDNKKEKDYLPELPSLPNNPKNNNLNQEIVKSAISDNLSSEGNEVDIDSQSQDSERAEESEKTFPISSQNLESQIPSLPGRSSIMDSPLSKPVSQEPSKVIQKVVTPHFSIPRTSKESLDVEPIFVRIDKFQLAKKNIEQIKNKIKEMESTIKKVKQVKVKEEEEIKSWLGEIENLKARLSEIDSDVFSQI